MKRSLAVLLLVLVVAGAAVLLRLLADVGEGPPGVPGPEEIAAEAPVPAAEEVSAPQPEEEPAVEVTARGAATEVVDEGAEEPQPLRLVGHVRDSRGAGIPGALVELRLERSDGAGGTLATGTSIVDGRFELVAEEDGAVSFDPGRRWPESDAELLQHPGRLARWLPSAPRMEGEEAPSEPGPRAERLLEEHRAAAESAERERDRLRGLGWRDAAESALVLAATRDGYRPAELRLAKGPALGGTHEVEIVLQLGVGLSGEVRLAEDLGLAVPDAEVVLLDALGEVVAMTRTNAAGQWRAGVAHPAPLTVFARRDGFGAAAEPFDPGFGGDARAPTLWLRGPGSVTGRVHTPDGRRVAGIAVEAVPEELAFAGAPALSLVERIEREAAGGCYGGVAVTDRDGGFAILGLLPGRYLPRFADVRREELQPFELVETPASVRLELAQHVLRIGVELVDPYEDARDTPLPPMEPRALLHELVRAHGGAEQLGRTVPARGALHLVDGGQRYRVGARADGYEPATLDILVTPLPWQQTAEITLVATPPPEPAQRPAEPESDEPDAPEPARLTLTLVDPEGEPLADLAGWRARLTDPAGERDALELELTPEPLVIPPGRWRVSIEPPPAAEDAPPPLALADEPPEVELAPGEERALVVRLAAPE